MQDRPNIQILLLFGTIFVVTSSVQTENIYILQCYDKVEILIA